MKKALLTFILFLCTASPAFASQQVLVGATLANAGAQSSNNYVGIALQASVAQTSSAQSSSTIPFSGVLSSLYVMTPGILSGSESYTFTVLQNGNTTSMGCTINSSSGVNLAGFQYCTDLVDPLTYVAGDGFYMQQTPANTPPQARNSWSIVSTPTTANNTWIAEEGVTNNNSTTAEKYRLPQFTSPQNNANATTTTMFFPEAGILDRLFVTISGTPSPGSYVNTVMSGPQFNENGQLATSTVTCTEVAGVSSLCHDTTHTLSVSMADMFTYSHTPVSSPTTRQESFSVRFVPSIAGHFDYFYTGQSNAFTGGSTIYGAINGGGFNTTEASSTMVVNQMIFHGVYAHFDTAPGGSETRTVTLRKNFVGTDVTCTVTGTATDCNDTGFSVAIVAGDVLDWEIVSSASASSALAWVSGIALPIQVVGSRFRQIGGQIHIIGGKFRIQ